MATCTVKLPDEFMSKLNEFDSRTEEIIEKSLKAGAEIVYKQAKSNLQNVIGSGTKFDSRSTGQLLKALGVSPVKSKDNGYDIKIGFAEPRSGGGTNAEIASILEYGKKKAKQAPKPFMKPAQDATQKKAKEEIQRVFTEEAQKIFK